ncbi:hypothetical protein CVD28_04585 [Bacillus sp. M6-12]|uniref:LTA synthase family protein n=1 Tax=Bacillus sp. M6-12 TaxID=2054166 RepID=UPI000C78E1D6|nr:LTA synthase family protein [Bacillus sp. M6-12]PLS19694.1 hypothetical protein CVD28_04585 [Bacillus sp. M6-12]
MKFKKMLKGFIQHPIFDISIFALLLYAKYLLLFDEVYIEGDTFLTTPAKIFTTLTLIAIAGLFWFVSNRKRKWILLFVSFFISISIFADAVYFRHFKDFTSFSLLYQVNQANDVKNAIFHLLQGKDILYFIDLIFIGVLLFLFKSKVSTKKQKLNLNRGFVYFTFLTMFLFGNFAFMLVHLGDDGIKDRNSNALASCMIGTINFHFVDTYESIKEKVFKPELNEQKIQEIRQSFYQPNEQEKNPYWASMKGKNILFVQMESFARYVVNEKIEGKEITPNFNKLIQESYYAENMYNQVGYGHTSDAEYLTLNSLYGLSSGSANILYGFNDYYTLPKILEREGYSTFSAHAYRGEFWNRVNMHKSYGFQESYFEKQFDIKDTAGLGMRDKDFFIQSVDKIATLQQPFFSFLITLENHTPFDSRDTDFNVGKLEGTQVGKYIQSVHEADKAIGILIEELKEKGLYNNTVLIMYGDHDSELEQPEMEKLFPDLAYNDLYKLKRVPFLIHTPDKSIVEIDKQPLGQIDTMPTILHLLGMKSEHAYFYGQNIFDQNREKIVGQIMNWAVGDGYVIRINPNDNNSYLAFNIDTNESIPVTEEMIEQYEKVQTQIKNSDLLIRTDGIKDIIKTREGE